MPNEPVFAVDLKNVLVDKQLSKEEIRRALNEIERVSFLEFPHADGTIEPIDITNTEWYRQKPLYARFRSILKIDYDEKMIFVKAILVKNDETYEKIVWKLYLEDVT